MVGSLQLDAAVSYLAGGKRRPWPGNDEHHHPAGYAESCRHVSRLSVLRLGGGQAGAQALTHSLHAVRGWADSPIRGRTAAMDHSGPGCVGRLLWYRILCRVGDHWQRAVSHARSRPRSGIYLQWRARAKLRCALHYWMDRRQKRPERGVSSVRDGISANGADGVTVAGNEGEAAGITADERTRAANSRE